MSAEQMAVKSVRIPEWMLDRLAELQAVKQKANRQELSTIIRVALAEYIAARQEHLDV